MNAPSATSRNDLATGGRWFHRLAVLLACITFPLIWVGGLVTTYDAGMAVPDWPGTYGYNLFLYPWQSWLSGPWDLFIEHGHRLLGATAGLVAIALVISAWLGRGPKWQRPAATVALALVIAQGVLGGARVLRDERLLAMVHGCVGPAFFALAVVLAVASSRKWQAAQAEDKAKAPFSLAVATAILAYTQLVLGAMVRHVPVTADPAWFRFAVVFHLLVAAVLTMHVLLLAWRTWRGRKSLPQLGRSASVLVGLLGCQIALGCATWVVKFGWPNWASQYGASAGYTVQNESMLQAIIITGHVATGSLILATAVVAAFTAGKLSRWSRQAASQTAGAKINHSPQGALA